jgi:hypothetical protein
MLIVKRKVIKRKRKQDSKVKMVKPGDIDKSRGMTSKEIKRKLNGMSLGFKVGMTIGCIGCKGSFSKKEADEERGDQWWRYGYCSTKCFDKMLKAVRGELKIRYGDYDYTKYYKAKKGRTVVKRSKRRIIKRGG